MKTFFKYCLFIFALAVSQMSWASNANCPTVNGKPMANCTDPTCDAGEKTYGMDYRKCINSCKDGYSATSDADLICTEKGCRDGYKSSGALTCTYTGSRSYSKLTGGCRDNYKKVAGVCWYKGAWDYGKDTYTRTGSIHYARNCPAGYTLTETQPSGFYYYCKLCNSNPTTSTALAINSGSYYNIAGTPNSNEVTLQSTVVVSVPLCNANGGTITTKFTLTNGSAIKKDVAQCDLQDSSGAKATGGVPGTFTCTAKYKVDTTGTWVVSGESTSNLGGKATKLASPSNNGNLNFDVYP